MPLSFLVPAFFAGLLAITIPIIVHLRRRQRTRVVHFPSLMFLEKVPFKAESRRRIHHWLLLSLRAIAVALIVTAFARPFFQDEDVAAGISSGPRELVVLIDRSYSMGIGDHWERAQGAARQAINGMGPLDRASVVFFARSAEVAVRSTADRNRLNGAIDTATVSAQSTVYGPGLKLAQTILDESELPGRELVLIGDFQRAGWTGDEGVNLPSNTVVNTIALADSAPPNRAVAAVNLTRQRFSGRDRITPTARLTRLGGDAPEDVEVILEIEGRELQRRTVTLPPDGATTTVFEPFTLADRHTRGTVRLATRDALTPDDAHHFVVSPGQALSVLMMNDGSGRGASSLYLREALSISDDNSFDVIARNGTGFTAAELADRAVVIVNDRPVPASAAGPLRAFVEGGGGLIVVLGERITWPGEIGDLLPGAFTGPVEREEGRGGRLGHLEYDHPVFEVFRGPRSGDFTGALFFRARDLQVPEGDSVQVLARYDDGSVALAEKVVGDGRVLVWTSTLDAFWNDLALQPVFLPFAHQLVRYASGRSETLQAFAAGQVLDVTDARAMATAGLGDAARALADEEERVALTPSGETLTLPTGAGPHFLNLEQQGFYEIRPPGNDQIRPLAVAVNVELEEADLAPLDTEEVVASITAGPDDGPMPASESAAADQLRREDQERRQSLWRFMILAAFLLLALETVVSNRVSRTAVRSGSHAST